MSRTVLETLITRQLHQYNRLKAVLGEGPAATRPVPGPVITISRMAGCCARDLAQDLAERFGVQVWGRELVDEIARDRGLRREVVEQLDQGLVSNVDAWVRGILENRLFMKDDYVESLARIVKTLAETGGAVIVGRGAGFILGDRADLRLRLVAGDRHRLAVLRQRRGLDLDEARALMTRTDEARAAFVRSYFGADVDDHRHYDLVINTERLGAGMMVEICEALVRSRRLAAREAESGA
jgi:cytidylate kinase